MKLLALHRALSGEHAPEHVFVDDGGNDGAHDTQAES